MFTQPLPSDAVAEALCYRNDLRDPHVAALSPRGLEEEGLIFAVSSWWVSLARFLIEFIRGTIRKLSTDQVWPLDVGQLLGVPFIIAGVRSFVDVLGRKIGLQEKCM